MAWLDEQLLKIPSGWVNNPAMTNLRSFALGMSDPTLGATQALSSALPASLGISERVQQAIEKHEQSLQSERGSNAGYDYARAAGNIGSPANLWGAAFRPAAAAPVVKAIVGSRYSAQQLS